MKHRNWVTAVATACLLVAAARVQALTVEEDFDGYTGILSNKTGGVGWDGAWQNGNQVLTNVTNLNYKATGYVPLPAGTGVVYTWGNGVDGILSNRRLASPIQGTTAGRQVWFSVQVQDYAAFTRAGLYVNSTTTDRNGAKAGFLLVGTDFRHVADGTMVWPGPVLASGVPHLVLGLITLKNTGASTVKFWLDPGDVTSAGTLGTANVSFTATFGGSITNVAVEGYGNAFPTYGGGFLDTIRLSDGDGSSAQAFLNVVSRRKIPNGTAVIIR